MANISETMIGSQVRSRKKSLKKPLPNSVVHVHNARPAEVKRLIAAGTRRKAVLTG